MICSRRNERARLGLGLGSGLLVGCAVACVLALGACDRSKAQGPQGPPVVPVKVQAVESQEIGEDDAVCAVASEMGCGSFEIRLAAGGRANLLATENCCVLVDDELLKQINCPASVVIATALNFSYAVAGQRIATVKSAPFAVAKDQLDAVIGILKERGPILQARPVRTPTVGVLYTDPVSGERARQ